MGVDSVTGASVAALGFKGEPKRKLRFGVSQGARTVTPNELASRRGTGMAAGVTLGGSYAPGDGYIDAPRNVLAYTAALTAHRVDVREHCAFTGLRFSGGRVVAGLLARVGAQQVVHEDQVFREARVRV